jgi:hypothetical protein
VVTLVLLEFGSRRIGFAPGLVGRCPEIHVFTRRSSCNSRCEYVDGGKINLFQMGAALCRERCASFHDSPAGRMPSIGVIKQMTGEAIYAALTKVP